MLAAEIATDAATYAFIAHLNADGLHAAVIESLLHLVQRAVGAAVQVRTAVYHQYFHTFCQINVF